MKMGTRSELKLKQVVILGILLLIGSLEMKAQELDQFRWKNRIVLILADQSDTPDFRRQIKELRNAREGLEERKLLVFQVNREGVSGLFSSSARINDKSLLEKYTIPMNGMKFVLIGLDGGVKYTSEKPVPAAELFAEIDRMPMRRAEIDRQ